MKVHRGTRLLAAVTKLWLSCGIQLLIPVVTYIFWRWGILSHCLVVTPCLVCFTRFLSLPISFSHIVVSLLWSRYASLLPSVSLWCDDIRMRAGDSSTSACLGMFSPPWSYPKGLTCGSQCISGSACVFIALHLEMRSLVWPFKMGNYSLCLLLWDKLMERG